MQDYNQQIEQIYQPTEQFIKEEIARLPSIYEPEKAAIEQAKVNAFRDISKEAFKRGRFFGGFQPEEQARYLGEKYLPGLQRLELAKEESKRGLMSRLIDVGVQKGEKKLSYAETVRQEALAREKEERDWQRQLKLASYGGGGGGGSSQTKLELKRNAAGGYEVYENGQKSGDYDLAGYARATGKSLPALLAGGDESDRRAATNYFNNIAAGMSEEASYAQLVKDRPTAYYLGG